MNPRERAVQLALEIYECIGWPDDHAIKKPCSDLIERALLDTIEECAKVAETSTWPDDAGAKNLRREIAAEIRKMKGEA